MAGLFRNDSKTSEGKYLVKRRDGTIPNWPWFVIGAKDPAAHAALTAYADRCHELGMDYQYVMDLHRLASEFESYCMNHGAGQPDAGPDRVDDPATIAEWTGEQTGGGS
jgi:hypothetical protein